MKSNTLINKFITYYRPHMKLFSLDIICATLVAVIDLLFPMLTRMALQDFLPDMVDKNSSLRPFLIFVVSLVGLYVIRTIVQYVVDFYGHVLGVRMEYDMRKKLFSHLQKLSFKFYDENRTGKLMSRMINDLNEMTELAHHGPEDLFISLIMLVGSFFAMIFIEWRLALCVYIFIPLLIFIAIKRRTKMSRSFKAVKKEIAEVNADLESSLSGIRVSKAFTNERYEIEKFDKGNMKFRGSKDEAYKNMAIFMSVMGFITNILNVVVIGAGGVLIYQGEMDYADLIAFTLYVNAFLMPIRKLTQFVQQFESGMTGFERFVEIMDIEPEIADKEEATSLDDVKGKIIFEHVSFSYNHQEKVLEDINLTIYEGMTIALVGPSGGGKTTLCHLIPRFYEINGGKLTIDNVDIRDMKLASLRGNIGLVSQDVFLFAGTIRENILYGRIDASDEEMVTAAKNARIHKFIMSLEEGYSTNIGERGIRLSGGQKQRISIARVFLKNPKILVLDEATSALDNETEMVKVSKLHS